MEKYNNVQRLGASRNSIYWILYQTLNKVNNKIYIGVHKTKNPYEFDGYLGCGIYINLPSSYMYAKTKMEAAVKKYGVSNFVRTTILIFTNEDDAYLEESRIVNEDFLSRSDVYNMIKGGKIPYCTPPVKVIYLYDLDGNFIKKYSSVKDAALSIKCNPATISDACANNMSCENYYWSFDKTKKLNMSQYHKIKQYNILYQYDINGNFVKELKSTRESGYTQASQSAILGNLVDGKYYFCYVKADNYSKARDKYVKSRIIYLYDANGNFIKEYNYLEALKQFPKDGINLAIRHKKITKSGHFWGLQKYDIYNKPVILQHKKVGKYDLNNNLLKIYNNTSECYKENGKGVYKNLVNLRKSYKGFIYKYIE